MDINIELFVSKGDITFVVDKAFESKLDCIGFFEGGNEVMFTFEDEEHDFVLDYPLNPDLVENVRHKRSATVLRIDDKDEVVEEYAVLFKVMNQEEVAQMMRELEETFAQGTQPEAVPAEDAIEDAKTSDLPLPGQV